MANPISQKELNQSLDNLAWELAQKQADELPPYLQDDELTTERFFAKNKDKLSKQDAINLLEKLVEEGKLEKQERRRKGKSGSRAVVYIVGHMTKKVSQ